MESTRDYVPDALEFFNMNAAAAGAENDRFAAAIDGAFEVTARRFARDRDGEVAADAAAGR